VVALSKVSHKLPTLEDWKTFVDMTDSKLGSLEITNDIIEIFKKKYE